MENSPDMTPQRSSLDHERDQKVAERRGFLTRFSAVVIGCVVGLFPFASGVLVFFDPLRKTSSANGSIRVTTLDSVPDDGIARQFPVIADKTDAWNRYPNEPIGSVYLRRDKGSMDVEALNAICPHAGCYVDFYIDQNKFQCPCHDSQFKPDGVRLNPERCPSPRDLDTLEVDQQRLQQGEVWVNFKDFLTGTPKKKEKD